LTVHSFYVIGLREGFPLYSRKWTQSDVDSALLSGFLASMEHMAQQVAAQHVNVVNMKDRRFFFQIDEDNGLLLVFITDVSESASRFRKYLGILNTQFVKMFHEQLEILHKEGTTDTTLFTNFDEFIDDLVLTWWMGESTVSAAKVMDVFEIFTLFYNTLLQRFLTEVSRRTYDKEIQVIFKDKTKKLPALKGVKMNTPTCVKSFLTSSTNLSYSPERLCPNKPTNPSSSNTSAHSSERNKIGSKPTH